MQVFANKDLNKLYKPQKNSNKTDNGQITIIGGSELFHGAAILALSTASRFVDMVFFASPDSQLKEIVEMKSSLSSFVWVQWKDLDEYVLKSDAVLIGPGLMRYSKSEGDSVYQETRDLVRKLLQTYQDKKWVIDAGALQTMDADWIPGKAILTPNKKEYAMLFKDKDPVEMAQKYECVIVNKAPITVVYSPGEAIEIHGGNEGLTKGGTGDILAGLTAALYAKNEPLLAATAASHILKSAADELYKKVGPNYSADDLASQTPITFINLQAG